MKVSNKIQN